MLRFYGLLSTSLVSIILLALLFSGCRGSTISKETTTTTIEYLATTTSTTGETTTVTTTGTLSTTAKNTTSKQTSTTTATPAPTANLRSIAWDSVDRIEIGLFTYYIEENAECRDKELFSRLFPLLQQAEGDFVRNSKGFNIADLSFPIFLYNGDTFIGKLTLVRPIVVNKAENKKRALFAWFEPGTMYSDFYELDTALWEKLLPLVNEAAGCPIDFNPGHDRFPTTTRPK